MAGAAEDEFTSGCYLPKFVEEAIVRSSEREEETEGCRMVGGRQG